MPGLDLAAPCPCRSGVAESRCCGPVLAGEPAATAEALMRSRYAAHMRGDADHLLRTWDPRTRPLTVDLGPERWIGLAVLECIDGGPDDDEGVVAFEARYEVDGVIAELVARSRFRRHAGRWVYVDDE